MARLIKLQSLELGRLRTAMARNDCPETRAAYWKAVADQARREADRLDAEAEALLTGGPVA
ncbi:hypothetical protein AB0I69_24490 [Streptomyces sp. NPDC050508]|uniref:hypothetical protein n=1 Tax=Streptomyces sp. NPDC050508 TaxID=3155405 RepID=UPI003442CCE4